MSDDFAGSSIQCPKCRRLVDVPTLSDIRTLTEDGTYKMGRLEIRDEPDRLAKLQRAFGPSRTDEDGNEIDLREKFGDDAIPMEDDDILEVVKEEVIPPKYDPVTGELVRAVPLKREPVKFDPATIPMAKAVINYAAGDQKNEFNGWRIWPEMFRLPNLFVMSIVLVAHVALIMMAFPINSGLLIIAPGFIFVACAIIAHYSNVVQEIAIDANDELPRPLRDLNWSEDIFGPFLHICFSLLLCYGPMFFAFRFPAKFALAYAMGMFIVGTILFPAVFLTKTTSGTILNLAPDRLLRVISSLGLRYLFLVALWALALVVYLAGNLCAIVGSLQTVWRTLSLPFGINVPLAVGYALLLIGIMLMHGFCWYLGLMYRTHHDGFDWHLQYHKRKKDIVRQRPGMTVAKPSLDPPIAKAIPAEPVRPNYPQSHA